MHCSEVAEGVWLWGSIRCTKLECADLVIVDVSGEVDVAARGDGIKSCEQPFGGGRLIRVYSRAAPATDRAAAGCSRGWQCGRLGPSRTAPRR